jgi:hypothetical protein
MANNKTDCENRAKITAEAQKAIDAIDPVLSNSNAQATDLRKALDLAKTTLNTIKKDPHHLLLDFDAVLQGYSVNRNRCGSRRSDGDGLGACSCTGGTVGCFCIISPSD